MAQKRMFSNQIIDTDSFLDLPSESQLFYFHLGMKADVKGFVEPKKIARLVGLKIESLKPLVDAGFVIIFDSGVIVITHWEVNNNIRETHEAPTRFTKELAQLTIKNNQYEKLQPNYSSSTVEVLRSIDEDSIDEDSIDTREKEITNFNNENNKRETENRRNSVIPLSLQKKKETSKEVDTPKGLNEKTIEKQINLLVDVWRDVNPNYRSFYANRTERRAMADLLRIYGFTDLRQMIEGLFAIVSQPYAPKITKPTELLRDLGKLKLFAAQHSQNTKGGYIDARE